jgi:Tfp pilus assembly protein PilO
MLTNRTSRWSIGAALLCIVLLAASWFLLISPRRADASTVRDQATQADNRATLLQTQIAQLKIQFAALPKQRAELKTIKRQLPPGADVSAFVRELQAQAAKAGVSLDSINLGTPSVLQAAGSGAPKVAAAGDVVNVPMTIVVTGEYFEGTLFVKNLQTKIDRSFLVTGFGAVPAVVTPIETPSPTATATAAATPTVSPTAAPITLDRITLTLQGSVFVLLDGTSTFDDVVADAKAAGSGSASATSTPTPTSTATTH